MVLGRGARLSPLVLVDAVDEAGARLAPAESELAAVSSTRSAGASGSSVDSRPRRRSSAPSRRAARPSLPRTWPSGRARRSARALPCPGNRQGAARHRSLGHSRARPRRRVGARRRAPRDRPRAREAAARGHLPLLPRRGERAPLGPSKGPARDRAAVLLWSIKEAAWKTLRPHRGVGLVDFEVLGVELGADAGSVA